MDFIATMGLNNTRHNHCVIMLSVVMQNVVMPGVVAKYYKDEKKPSEKNFNVKKLSLNEKR